MPLIDDNIRLKCLVNSGQGMWLASSKGLTLYHADGSIDKHFGSPHGLINNELESGVCSASYTQEQILFSSMFGLLAIQTTPLANAEPPHSSLILVRSVSTINRYRLVALLWCRYTWPMDKPSVFNLVHYPMPEGKR